MNQPTTAQILAVLAVMILMRGGQIVLVLGFWIAGGIPGLIAGLILAALLGLGKYTPR